MRKTRLWFYVSFLPTFMAILGIFVSTLVYIQGWGADKNADMIVRVFFCEITFVISMLGLLSYLRQPNKSKWVKIMFWVNVSIVINTLLLSIFFFLAPF